MRTETMFNSRADTGGRRVLVAPESKRVGVIAMVIVACGLLAVSPGIRYHMYWHSDAPFFYAIARHPFGSGGVTDHPLVYGVAYRYGRIMYPLTAWVLALGRPRFVPGTLLVVYLASFGAWFALAAEHLRRNGRRPELAFWIFALPFCLRAFFQPVMVSDPMAGALLLLVYLFERDGRRRSAYITAALLILTREPMVLALAPLVWTGWKQRRFAALRDWALVCVPYGAWIVWVRFRVGQFPFLDPSVSRREALAGPFAGYVRSWQAGGDIGHALGWIFPLATLAVVGFVAVRGRGRSPLTHGVVALSALIPFFGIAVFRHMGEAFRVMAPIQALLLVVVLDRRSVFDDHVSEGSPGARIEPTELAGVPDRLPV